MTEKRLSKAAVAKRRKLRLEAMNLQAIEGNPLDAEDIAMFEMFEREGWDDDRCRAYIKRLRSRACQQVRDILTPGIRAFRTQKVALVGPIPDYAPMAAALLPP